MTNIAVYARSGGQGKTTIAVTLAHYFNGRVLTNDHGRKTREKYKLLLEPERIIDIDPDQDKLKLEHPTGNVFDFGGIPDNRIKEVAKFVDYFIIPIYWRSPGDELTPFDTITEILKYTKNIIVVINSTKKKDQAKKLSEAINVIYKLPTVIIPESNALDSLSGKGITPFDMNKNMRTRYNARAVYPPFKELVDYITKDNKNDK